MNNGIYDPLKLEYQIDQSKQNTFEDIDDIYASALLQKLSELKDVTQTDQTSHIKEQFFPITREVFK